MKTIHLVLTDTLGTKHVGKANGVTDEELTELRNLLSTVLGTSDGAQINLETVEGNEVFLSKEHIVSAEIVTH